MLSDINVSRKYAKNSIGMQTKFEPVSLHALSRSDYGLNRSCYVLNRSCYARSCYRVVSFVLLLVLSLVFFLIFSFVLFAFSFMLLVFVGTSCCSDSLRWLKQICRRSMVKMLTSLATAASAVSVTAVSVVACK